MFNLFSKAKEDDFSYHTMRKMFDYCQDLQSGGVDEDGNTIWTCLEIDAYKGYVCFLCLLIPNAYENHELRKELKQLGLNNFFQALNFIYKRANIAELTEDAINELIKNKSIFPFLRITTDFCESRDPKKKNKLIAFYLFFVNLTDKSADEVMRVFYNEIDSPFTLKSLANAKFLEDYKKPNADEVDIAKQWEVIVVGTAQKLGLELPKELHARYPESIIAAVTPITLDEVKEFILKINFNAMEGDIDELAETYVTRHNRGDPPRLTLSDTELNVWATDWKFDPEDAEYAISDMIGEEFTYDYPEDTYSHQLFPYIQKALLEKNLVLLGYYTGEDCYKFFIAHKSDEARIFELAEKLGVDIEAY